MKESSINATVQVIRSAFEPETAQTVSVRYRMIDGTATSNAINIDIEDHEDYEERSVNGEIIKKTVNRPDIDYIASTGTLIFEKQEIYASIHLQVKISSFALFKRFIIFFYA